TVKHRLQQIEARNATLFQRTEIIPQQLLLAVANPEGNQLFPKMTNVTFWPHVYRKVANDPNQLNINIRSNQSIQRSFADFEISRKIPGTEQYAYDISTLDQLHIAISSYKIRDFNIFSIYLCTYSYPFFFRYSHAFIKHKTLGGAYLQRLFSSSTVPTPTTKIRAATAEKTKATQITYHNLVLNATIKKTIFYIEQASVLKEGYQCWNRDVSAAANIRSILVEYIRQGFNLDSRPAQLSRGQQDQEL
ncbi:hypothetical protein INT48_007670, partial [Thamnidium elegans]